MDVTNSLLRAARAGHLKRVLDFIEDDLVNINSSNQNGLTALHSASKEGHLHVVEALIKHGANVHAKTHKGNTALHIASLGGHEPVVRALIENGADVDAQSASGFTSLYMAAQENHESIIKLLLASGANQNLATTDGFTPLAVAMQQGHEQIAAILLNNEAKGRIRFPGTTESGRSLLHIAAKKDDCAAAALLMQNNISPDLTSKSGFTALHVACHYGNEAVAKLLIDRQADVNFHAKHNITPLHVAAKWGQEKLVDLLLINAAKIDATTRDGLTPLHCASRSGHDTVVEDLIRRGAPISAKTRSGLAPLHMATQGDHLKSAQILLNNGAPVDDVTVDYLTALHVASHCGHVKVAKLLLNNKADPNFRALNGFTSLHIACKKNRLKIVELLLKYGASLNAVTESGLTPLHVASFMGCVQIVIYLLDNHADIRSVTVRGETPLHLATRANQIEVIKILLKYGADVGARAKESQTALHIASRLGNADIAKLLIEQGIDVDAPTKDSYTALHIASKEGHEEVVSTLLNYDANIACATRNHGFTPLHLASKYGIDGVVDLLLSYGAPVDAQGKNGVTPLHVATHYDHLDVVQLLLRGGASPHAMAKNGYTALHIAAKGNRLDIAQALLQHKADSNAESKAGFSPLHLAAQEGRRDMAALLLNNGAGVNSRAKNGITPLHLCAQEDHVNVAQLLVKRGAYLDEQTKGGFTPLHVASHFARIKMIRFLLANGANVNIPAASGYTPLHQASQQGNPEIVELLLQYNAKPDALTENGQTALSIAQNLGYVSIIDTLKVVTETVVKTTTLTITEEKFKIIAPETMQETFVSDSEDEADDTAHAESVKFLTTDVMKNFNSMADDYNTSQSNLVQIQNAAAGERPASRQQVVLDEMSQDLTYLSRDAPLDGGESTFGVYSQLGGQQQREDSVMHMGSDADSFTTGARQLESPTVVQSELALEQLSPDNVEIQQRPLQQAGDSTVFVCAENEKSEPKTLPLKPFLVSFMVDAQGGAMRGCRHSGVRVIIPPNSAQMPMRITCRYLRRERLVHPPPLMEGEACASKIMEVGPAGAKFLGPVLIEVPHFASLRGQEREIIILRSDKGDVWREHLVEADEKLIDSIIVSAADSEQDQQASKENFDSLSDSKRRLTRIVTTEFPQYFAIISRIRQEVHAVGPEGSTVNSQVVPRVQAIFTEGALTKRIKIGLQPKGNKKDQQAQQQDTHADQLNQTTTTTATQDSTRTDFNSIQQQEQNADNLEQQERAVSPLSNQGSQTTRPGSASAKRRSKLLACFGAGHGSIDLLNTTDESSAGGDSPRQLKSLRGDESAADDDRSSPSPATSISGALGTPRRRRHVEPAELVPDDYYIEKEPALILNVEPKTYGKRLASSSAQTDKQNNFMSTSTRKQAKKRGLLRGKRKNKTQLTIRCDSTAPADSSLDTVQLGDSASAIQDVFTSDDQKWRTCTIQTDSDSVTVNYVTIASSNSAAAASSAPDDGYVSGSGELKQSKGLFGFGADKASAAESKKSRKAKKTHDAATNLDSLESRSDAEQQLVSLSTIQSERAGAESSRSASPISNKELKQKLKREKEEKKQQKDAAAKAEKLRKKQEKEALKKKSKAKSSGEESAKSASQVKFATEPLVEGASEPEKNQLDSIERVIEESSSSYEKSKERLSQEDGRDMVHVSIGEKLTSSSQARSSSPTESQQFEERAEKLISFSDSEQTSSLQKEPQASFSEPAAEQAQSLKPILKQQSTISSEEAVAEIVIGEPAAILANKLVSEATDEAVSAADSLKATTTSSGAPPSKKELAKQAKEEKERQKRELKEKKLEEKRLAKEAKRAKAAVVSSSSELEPTETISKQEIAKQAKEEKNRLKSEAKAKLEEEKKAAKEAKKQAKLELARQKKEKKSQHVADETPDVTVSASVEKTEEPVSSASKSSFFSRLFSRSSAAKAPSESEPKLSEESRAQKEGEENLVIMSEMYPSDPDDADGEMILEVNVPKNLIDKQQLTTRQTSVTSETLASPTQATTIDETFATTDEHAKQIKSELSEQQAPIDDQEATLINVSQMITSEVEDEDATENLVSQANDIELELNQTEAPKQMTTQPLLEESKQESDLSKVDLKEEKTRRELEAKLEREAKKRAKEEEKQRKKQEKIDKKLAEAEAKRLAKEEKERLKREAKEAKKLAELEKKKSKKEKKLAKPSEAAAAATVVEEAEQFKPEDSEAQSDEQSSMKPVQTETEVQRIVEEVVGEDGVVTKTTKTIETKYVTLRQEEVQVNEQRTEFPITLEPRRASSSSSLSGSSIDSQGNRREERRSKKKKKRSDPVEPPMEAETVVFKHAELEEIQATPSYFSSTRPEEIPAGLSDKKEMKKRMKLNQKLIKRAQKLAKSEAKLAKRSARAAEAEIAVCDEAAKEARKKLKLALKEAKRASKVAAKEHKQMDKTDKKLAKRQKKIEKRQKKLDKASEKAAKKAEKRRAKLAAKEAKLERKSSGSKKSIKLEDIGEPVLRSSSRLEIQAATDASASAPEQIEMVTPVETVIHAHEEQTSGAPVEFAEKQVEFSLEAPAADASTVADEQQVAPEQPIVGEERPSESDEEIDVVNELPTIKGKLQQVVAEEAEQ